MIQDVISQVKEAFLDENVDIDVLSQLKKVISLIFSQLKKGNIAL